MNPLDSIVGSVVTATDYDWGLVVRAPDWTVRLIGPFEESVAETKVTVDPEEITIRSDRVGIVISAIDYDATGVLVVEFADDLVWRVPPSDSYEAWEVATKRGRLICSIGGQIAQWDF